jgi:DNA ligase-1
MFLSPMLLQKRETPFDDDRYVFEPKIDGHRMIISIQNGEVRLFTRNNNDVTNKYPELHDVPIDDHSDVVLDGEVACIDSATGSIEFELIQERFQIRKPEKIREAMQRKPVVFFAFDVLRYKGRDLRACPLWERKAVLEQALNENQSFKRVLSIRGKGVALFEAIKHKQLEGIVAKVRGSKYVGRRDVSWLKIINYSYADVEIAGYRKDDFGWLLRHNSKPVGVLELAVPTMQKKAFYGVTRSLVTGEDKNFVYLEPRIKAQVRFRNWYRSGMLRSPEFVKFVM